LLNRGETERTHSVVVRREVRECCCAVVMKVRRVLPRCAQRVVRYALLAVRAAYAPSTPVSVGACSLPLFLSVPDPPMVARDPRCSIHSTSPVLTEMSAQRGVVGEAAR
jgi:hypothetical protein